MKQDIPTFEKIILEEIKENEWKTFSKGLVGEEIKTKARVPAKAGSSRMVRIKLTIQKIIPPKKSQGIVLESDSGIAKASSLLNDYLNESTWTFLGYFNEDKETAIIILYSLINEVGFYRRKLLNEKREKFFAGSGL